MKLKKLVGLDMRKKNFKKLIDVINELTEITNFNSEQIENIKNEIRILNGDVDK